MPFIFPISARLELARSLHRDISNQNDFFYVSIGRVLPWPIEMTPPTPQDFLTEINDAKRDILAVQRIDPNDVILMVDRLNWVTGTVYTQYDDRTSNVGTDFYVLNTARRVYKCLDNNGGAQSTIEPTGSQPYPVVTADGYIWMFMQEIAITDTNKFLTNDYMPVRFYSDGVLFDHNGYIDGATVTVAGTGYVVPPLVTITGDGTGATATATIGGGLVTGITITGQGTGYTFAQITIAPGPGTTAQAVAILGVSEPYSINLDVASSARPGAIYRVDVDNGGTLYETSTTTTTVVGDGVNLVITPTFAAGVITGAPVVDENVGDRYTFADITVSGLGSGAALHAVIPPQGGHGSNVPKELYATIVGINVSLETDSNDLFPTNDYRQVGIVKNIRTFDGAGIFTLETGTSCFIANLDIADLPDFDLDDLVETDSGGQFTVAHFVDLGSTFNVWLKPIVPFITLNSVLTTPSNTLGTSINSITDPDITVFSGEMIFLNNIESVSRDPDQVESVRLFLKF